MIQRHTKAYRHATWTLAFSSFLIFCLLYSIQPMLTLFSSQYQVSETLANWVFAAASLGLSLFLIPWAVMADHFGRKRILSISLTLSAVISCLLFFSHNLTTWIVLRFLLGSCLAGLPAVAVAYITEEFEPNAVIGVIGFYIAANSIGGISGRIIGGLLAESFSIQVAMLFFSGLTILGAIVSYFYLPKEQHFTPQSLKIQLLIENLCQHIRNPLLWRTFIVGGIAFGMFTNTFTVIGLRLEYGQWQFSTTQVSLLFLCYLSGTFAATMSGKLSQRLNTPKSMFLGWIIYAVGLLLLLTQSLVFILSGLLITSIGFFMVHSLASAWVGKQAKQARALASALYLSVYYLGASLGGVYLISIFQRSQWYWVPLSAELLLLLLPILIFGMAYHLHPIKK